MNKQLIAVSILSMFVGCVVGEDSTVDPTDTDDGLGEEADDEEGPLPEDESSDAHESTGDRAAPPLFQLPFPCNQGWSGQTRTNHSPQASIDFNRAGDEGDTVSAAAAGTVTRVGNLGATSYGRWIEISHGNGFTTRYAHLSAQTVSVGQTVRQGQKIGAVGNTGGSTGAHLHYEQRKNGVAVRGSFNGAGWLFYGTKTYTSRNACAGATGSPGRIDTAGTPLTIRAGASSTTAARGTVADGTHVTITCQKRGESITGTFGTSTLWDNIGTGFVADAYVSTGADGQVAPTCP